MESSPVHASAAEAAQAQAMFWSAQQALRRCGALIYQSTFVLLSILLITPLWLLRYLPLTDLPEHAAQLRSIMDFEHYRDAYRLNWFTPYLFGYGLALFFAQFVSIITALKISLSLALLGVPLACAALLRALRANRYWVWASFPLAFSFSYYWGFFNFVVATPLAIGFFAYTVSYARQTLSKKTYALAAVFSLVLFVAHAMIWAYAVVIAVVILAVHAPWRVGLRKGSAFFVIFPLILWWVALSGKPGVGVSVEAGNYLSHYGGRLFSELSYVVKDLIARMGNGAQRYRLKEMASMSVGLPAMPDFIALGLLFVSMPFVLGARLTRNWRELMPLLTVMALFLLTPYWIFDTAYVYQRSAVFLIPAAFFMFARSDYQRHGHAGDVDSLLLLRRPIVHGVAFVLAALTLAGSSVMFWHERPNDRAFANVLAHMAPGKRVLSLVFDQGSVSRYSPAYMHFGNWYQAEKRGEVLPSFAHDDNAANVPIRYAGSKLPLPSSWESAKFNWISHRGASYDYFLIRSKTPRDALFGISGGSVRRVYQEGNWYLYEYTPVPLLLRAPSSSPLGLRR